MDFPLSRKLRPGALPDDDARTRAAALPDGNGDFFLRACGEGLRALGIADDSTIQRHVQAARRRTVEEEKRRVRESKTPFQRKRLIGEVSRQLAEEKRGGFSLLIMMDGWMERERGPDWGKKPAQAAGDRVC